MNIRKSGLYRRAVAGVALAFSLAIAAPAIAGPNPPPEQGGDPQASPMTVVGFDERVANENGYEVRVNSDGHRFVVPETNEPGDIAGGVEIPDFTDLEGGSDVSPMDTRYGNCGTSSINFSNHYTYLVGFAIYPQYGSAVYRDLRVAENGSAYIVKNFRGVMLNSTWTGTGNFTAGGYPRSVWVSSGSTVTTALGITCNSAGPIDHWG